MRFTLAPGNARATPRAILSAARRADKLLLNESGATSTLKAADDVVVCIGILQAGEPPPVDLPLVSLFAITFRLR
jgi:hypothetical protein